jgi:hypothetical protein
MIRTLATNAKAERIYWKELEIRLNIMRQAQFEEVEILNE